MGHLFATVILGPLLLIQGRMVRRNTPRLAEPEGVRQGIGGAGPPLRLLIIGDSAAAGVGVTHQKDALCGQLVALLAQHFTLSWALHAKTGATTADTIEHVNTMGSQTFDVVLTSLGVNDVTSGSQRSKWLAQQNALFTFCQHTFSSQLIVITALPPLHAFPALPQPLRGYLGRRATQFNAQLEQLTLGDKGKHFLALKMTDKKDAMAADGFHPGADSYRQWASQAAAVITKHFLPS